MVTTLETNLKKTSLYENHLSLKARMVPFGGWEMPVQYESILSEYDHTRKSAAIFDTSHMGEFFIEGDCTESGLDNIVTMPLRDMAPKICRYGLMLNREGGTMDDLIVFRLKENQWFIVVNGGTIQKDKENFQRHLNSKAIFKDLSSELGKIDIQGPQSREVLTRYVSDINKLKFYSFDTFTLLGEKALISRTGYTGELGFEIYFPWDKMSLLWQELLRNKEVKPAGLGARDILRLEMGYSLYGHELDEHITPLEAGLERFVDFKKDFIGKGVLIKQKQEGVKKKLVGFASDNRRSPRSHQKIYSLQEKEMGEVSSGTFSPSLHQGIGLGFIEGPFPLTDEKIYFGDEKNKFAAMITQRPFYKKGSLKN